MTKVYKSESFKKDKTGDLLWCAWFIQRAKQVIFLSLFFSCAVFVMTTKDFCAVCCESHVVQPIFNLSLCTLRAFVRSTHRCFKSVQRDRTFEGKRVAVEHVITLSSDEWPPSILIWAVRPKFSVIIKSGIICFEKAADLTAADQMPFFDWLLFDKSLSPSRGFRVKRTTDWFNAQTCFSSDAQKAIHLHPLYDSQFAVCAQNEWVYYLL